MKDAAMLSLNFIPKAMGKSSRKINSIILKFRNSIFVVGVNTQQQEVQLEN